MRKILIVGMLDSVHLARWLSQFEDENFQITLFPSSRFRRLHPEIKCLISTNRISLYNGGSRKVLATKGVQDFLKFEIFSTIRNQFLRSNALKKYLRKIDFDILHLIELQHAGYTYLETGIACNRSFKIILTNYGSDLIYFMDNPNDRDKLVSLMKLSDYYSAECRRDYQLAMELGFKGTNLPLMPNAGGIDDKTLQLEVLPLTERRIVYVKGYGGKFGLGAISLNVAARLLEAFPSVEVTVVSLTNDLKEAALALQTRFKGRFMVHGIGDGLDREEVLSILRKSIICIGASQSDGISTTFLEALACGAIPIQTNTSCANEWIEKGFFAKVVAPNEAAIYESASEILENITVYQPFVRSNMELSKIELSYKKLAQVARTFYLEGASDGK